MARRKIVGKIYRDWIFINVPRTGSSSAARLFRALHPHKKIVEFRGYRHMFSAAFLRNPYDRLVSCWENCRGQAHLTHSRQWKWRGRVLPDSFDRWVFDFSKDHNQWMSPFTMFRTQASWITAGGVVAVKFLGLYENYAEDMQRLCQIVDWPYRSVWVNRSKLRRNRPWQSYYTQQSLDIIKSFYAEDFAIWEQVTKVRNGEQRA